MNLNANNKWWMDRWFSLPVLHWVYNLFHSKKLILPKDIRDWTISNRNIYSQYLKDAGERVHKVTNCSSLLLLGAEGTNIPILDPYLPPHVQVSIPLPQKSDSPYIGDKIDSAGSTLMVIGKEHKVVGPGSTLQTVKIYTKLADLDILGWNPNPITIRYTYDPNDPSKDKVLIPFPDWQEHQITLTASAKITETRPTILQTGPGIDARELRLEGCDASDNTGYYKKMITELGWTFVRDDRQITAPYYPAGTVRTQISTTPIVHNWSDTLSLSKIADWTASLKDFSPDNLHGRIELKKPDGTICHAKLYRKVNLIWASIFNKDDGNFDLIPKSDIPGTPLRKNKPVRVKASLSKDGKKLTLARSWWRPWQPNIKFNLDKV